jgi:hypothetical protein
MRRLVLVVSLGGVVLLAAWRLAPFVFVPSASTPAPALAPADHATAIVADVDAQVARLRNRLAVIPALQPVVRDPFAYGARLAPPSVPPPVALAAPPRERDRGPVLPRLVAIESGAGDGARVAVFAAGDDLVPVKPGDSIGSLIVSHVEADSVELSDPKTGQTFHVR